MSDEIHGRFATYYDKLHHFKDYEGQTATLVGLLRAAHPGARTLLEVACGTGLFTAQLRRHFAVEGVDISSAMLDAASRKLPGIPFHQGDMVNFDLGRRFDVVACLFSSIAYARTEERMNDAVAAMARHVAPGGLLAIEPFYPPERYWAPKVFMNLVQEDDLKISWIYIQENINGEARLHYHFTVGTPEKVEHFTEEHWLGLFTDEMYRKAFARLGMSCEFIPAAHAGRGLYLARAPG